DKKKYRGRSAVWEASAKSIYKSGFTTDWQPLLTKLCGNWKDRIESFIVRYVFQTTVYTIWRERNGRRHGSNPTSASRIIGWIDKQIRDQLSTIKLTGDRRYDNGLQFWFGSRN
ncbi:unnamed protein product, partial [Arabidopsis halleri]